MEKSLKKMSLLNVKIHTGISRNAANKKQDAEHRHYDQQDEQDEVSEVLGKRNGGSKKYNRNNSNNL